MASHIHKVLGGFLARCIQGNRWGMRNVIGDTGGGPEGAFRQSYAIVNQ